MNANMLSAQLFGDTEVATPLEIIASGALYEAGFSTPKQKTRNRSFSRPSGMRLRGWGRRLTKTEEQESIIKPLCQNPLIRKRNPSQEAEPPLFPVPKRDQSLDKLKLLKGE